MIKLKDGLKEFIHIFNTIENICDETNVSFLFDGVHVRVVHMSNHCLVSIKIDKNLFEEYDLEKEQTYTLNISLFNKILRLVKGKGLLIESNEDKLTIKTPKKTFNMNYFVRNKDNRERPEIPTTSKWNISSNELFNNISNLIEFSDLCKFHGNDKLTLRTKSSMVDGVIELNAKRIDGCECSSYYDITYIEAIKDIKNIFKEVRIGFSNDNPFVLRATNDNINFEFILAGRMENE